MRDDKVPRALMSILAARRQKDITIKKSARITIRLMIERRIFSPVVQIFYASVHILQHIDERRFFLPKQVSEFKNVAIYLKLKKKLFA